MILDEHREDRFAGEAAPVIYGIVYLTSRVLGGQVVRRYIGQHRIRAGRLDDGYLGSGKIISAAIRKHGRHSFVRETLEMCLDQKGLDAAERKWVTFFDAVRSTQFYNLAEGGRGQNAKNEKRVHQFSPDGNLIATFDSVALAAASIGCAESQITLACKKPKRTAVGYGWSFYLSRSEPIKVGVMRKVQKLSEDGLVLAEFDSVALACRSMGVKTGANLTACCRGKRKSFRGFRWRYSGEPTPERPVPEGDRRIFVATARNGVETRFRGLSHIREILGGAAVCNVIACCKGERKKVRGYTWRVE